MRVKHPFPPSPDSNNLDFNLLGHVALRWITRSSFSQRQWKVGRKDERICSLCLLFTYETIPSTFLKEFCLQSLSLNSQKHLHWAIIKTNFLLEGLLQQCWLFVGSCQCPCLIWGKVNRHKNVLSTGGGGRTQHRSEFPPPLHSDSPVFVSAPPVLLKLLSQNLSC